MPVIDAHVHLYPPAVNHDPAGWAVAQGESQWALMCARVRKNTGRPVQGFPSLRELLDAMDAAGVDRAVLLGWYWETQASCVMQNRFYAECVRAHPDRLSAFAAVNPKAGDAVLDEIRRAKDVGLIGLGELSPHSQRVALADPCWQAVLELAAELQLPVNLHVTEPEGRPYPGRVDTPPPDFVEMARAHPRLKFILAHWGGRFWRYAEPMPDNVWLDTAATPLLYKDDGIWREAVSACPANRILWGTDYPLHLYPAEPGRGTFSGMLAEARARFSPEDQARVLGGNAACVIGC